jgi:hypothetical protein
MTRTYTDVEIGCTNFSPGASVRVQNQDNRGVVSVYLWINDDPNGHALHGLKADRVAIESGPQPLIGRRRRLERDGMRPATGMVRERGEPARRGGSPTRHRSPSE